MILTFKRFKKIRLSFASLGEYLVKVGNRERVEELLEFPYEEFTNVVKTVDEMSDRIAQAEQMQKQFFQNASHEFRPRFLTE